MFGMFVGETVKRNIQKCPKGSNFNVFCQKYCYSELLEGY